MGEPCSTCTTRVLTLGNQSVIWLVVADTEAGVRAGVEDIRSRAVGGEFDGSPIEMRPAGGYSAAGSAVLPGHCRPQWTIDVTEVVDLQFLAETRRHG